MMFGGKTGPENSLCDHRPCARRGDQLLDTANGYSHGRSGGDRQGAQALASDKVVLATKVPDRGRGDPTQRALAPGISLSGARLRCGDLQTDYIDLYQTSPAEPEIAHRRDARGAERPSAGRQDALYRRLHLSGLASRGSRCGPPSNLG